MSRAENGMTLLELLIVIAILGIILGVGAINGRRIAQRQTAHGAVATFQQSVWQGATAAASRGLTVELVRTDKGLDLINTESESVLRSFELPSSTTINVANPILRFLPPRKISTESLASLSDELVVDTGDGRYRLEKSLIGEVASQRIEEGQ